MPRRKPAEPTRFLNVDLDLRSSQDLTPLLDTLQPHAHTIHDEPGLTSLELNEHAADVESTLLVFVAAIEALPAPARALWDRCEERAFDVGIEGGLTPHSTTFPVTASTLEKLARLGATLRFTIYAPES